jgi:hypothetical protein
MSDLVGKVERRARKPQITQEMISKMDERRKWKNANNKEGRKNYRRLRNELKRATDNTEKEYLESICNEIIEFQRTGRYNLMYMKTKEQVRDEYRHTSLIRWVRFQTTTVKQISP